MEDKNEIRVKIENPKHLFECAFAYGIMEGAEVLENVDKGLRGTPGFALAQATLSAKANSARADITGTNLRIIAGGGVDISKVESVTFDPSSGELVCKMHDLTSALEGG